MKKFALVVMTFATLTCHAAPKAKQKAAVVSNPVLAHVHEAVSRTLRDPTSALFADEFIVEKSKESDGSYTIVVCGTLNAKNAYGGYTGAERYLAINITDDGKTFQTIGIHVDNHPTYKRSATARGTDEDRESYYEKLYWNQNCVDGKHPQMYTSTNWQDYRHN